jgi:WD40 repeat protein
MNMLLLLSVFLHVANVGFASPRITEKEVSLVIELYDEAVKLWDTTTVKGKKRLKGHSDTVYVVKFSPNGRQIASGSGDNNTKPWDAMAGKVEKTLMGHLDAITAVIFSPDGGGLASGFHDNTIKVRDVVRFLNA